MSKCTGCGADLRDNQIFCEQCGVRVQTSEVKAPAPEPVDVVKQEQPTINTTAQTEVTNTPLQGSYTPPEHQTYKPNQQQAYNPNQQQQTYNPNQQQQQTYNPNYPSYNENQAQTNSVPAIIGFILSLISLFFNPFMVLSIASIIVSCVGLKQCKDKSKKGKGLAVTGLIIGIIACVIAFGVLLCTVCIATTAY